MRICSHCQKEVNKKAISCMYCGEELEKESLVESNPPSKKGKIGMVLAIAASLVCLSAFTSISIAQETLAEQNINFSYRIGFGIGFVLLQTSLSIAALCLSYIDRKKQKNIKNIGTFYGSLLILVCVVIQFILVVFF